MSINPTIWPKLHGASTHFPVALAMAAALFETLAVFAGPVPGMKTRLRAAGYFTIILGALGTFPAVLSGLFMTRGSVLGHDALLFHHLFVWPAFAALVGLGVWRAMVGETGSPRGYKIYLALLLATAGLMAGAGYWGGELILNS